MFFSSWLIGHAINGGVLMALGASGAASGLANVGHPDLLTWGAHFLSAAVAGPVEVRVEVLRVGRTVSTAEIRVIQEGDDGRPHERVRMTGTFGSLDRAEPVHRAPFAPEVPSPDDVPARPARRLTGRQGDRHARPDGRADRPVDRGVRGGAPDAGAASSGPGCGSSDGREPDVAMLPWAVDALMPVSFDLGAPGWAPDDGADRPAAGPARARAGCSPS